MDINERLRDEARYIDKVLADCLIPLQGSVLYAAVSYSLLSPGKRVRPALCLAVYEECTRDRERIRPVLAAVEMVHAYSVIQDDLPSMDNSPLRRGKPTTHVVHGADMALLASDALLTLAFEELSAPSLVDAFGADRCLQAVHTLATLAGANGLVGGQAMDVITSTDTEVDLATVEYIHRNKTAALIEASVLLGGIFGCASPADMERLKEFGESFGMAYQIVDDVADATSTEAQAGKPVGQDLKNRKATFATLLGLEGAREKALQYLASAREAAGQLSGGGEFLVGLVDWLVEKVRG
ncbi:MAG TPA: polyprenyl synthetase family protein [Candidatus Cryosericum sp.]|nr:polyprenyl synthetase family protein [Candidatus Cryosericum sp.]